MSFYEDLTKSLNEAIQISKGEKKVVPKEGFKDFYTINENSKDAKPLNEWANKNTK